MDLEPMIRVEYDRVSKQLGEMPKYPDRRMLSGDDVLRAHFLIANYFYLEGSGLGGIGPRDDHLLKSAISRQHAEFCGEKKWADHYGIMATLFYGIIKNHAFYDANKRTALLVLLYHLQTNGLAPLASQVELENLTVDVADNALDKREDVQQFREWKSVTTNHEIDFLAHYLRRNSRIADHRNYTITYHQLKRILPKFGFEFGPPDRNFIDVLRTDRHRQIFPNKTPAKPGQKVYSLVFPGWTREVEKNTLKALREAAELDAPNGVDSTAFYEEEEPIDCLIAEYNTPLRNLAVR